MAEEVSIEPNPLDLEAFRRNGYALVDWVSSYLDGLDERPVGMPVEPGEVRAKLPQRAPEESEAFNAILADLDQIVAPGLTHWQHPGWLAYFPAGSSPASILGEMSAAAFGIVGMMWSTSPAATELESHILDWLVDLLGVPQEWKATGPGGGVLQPGASSSTHTALVAARDLCGKRTGADHGKMAAYASREAHSSVEKGARMAGFGHIRLLDTDDDFSLRLDALVDAIEADRQVGLVPAFVCSAVGTTGTTAVDPVRRVGEIAEFEHMWHHVDAAYAGSAMICEEFRKHQDGLELVDSYTFNPHKWLATNMPCSVMWVADRGPLIDAMSVMAPYLQDEASASGKVIDYRDWHLQLGRPFNSLKLWFVLRSFGAEGLRKMIRSHVEWARWLAEEIDNHSNLVLIAPVPFGLVSFAHTDGDPATDVLLAAINADGRFYLTGSEIAGRRYIRISVGSIWTTQAHIQALWELIAAKA